ncbi:hypothetical protein G7Y89_g11708 [Cudoniella acicularis]|uniref:Major facilitator superfamily (MFS) profile domain-containing protein n=1 Tax=Cudoniella acicularis TaxID=354080 RepID=A0A8H4RE15_9HELO|nr:hypothetical protein G7Y89_g11708 [Cudoniella acicularis]
MEREPETPETDSSERESPFQKKPLELSSVDRILSDEAFPEGGARAWMVAIGAGAALFSTMGYANAFGVYQEYYQEHQLRDETPSAISWIGSLQMFMIFASGVISGPLFDRYGEKIIWPSSIIYIFAVMMTSICKSLWQFVLAQGILGGFTMGMILGPSMTATSHYFKKNRAAAMGIIVAASSAGGVVFPIALSKMFNNRRLGFEWTVRICGFMILALLTITCVGIKARLPPRKERFLLPEAFKQLPYTALIASVFLMLLGLFIPFFYLPTYAIEHGMSVGLASYLVSILNAASFFGRVIPGILADRLGRFNMLFASALSAGILIFCWPKTSTNASIIVFSTLYGFCSGAIVSLSSVCLMSIPEDPRDIGTYYGMAFFIVSIAALVGPPINGALVTLYGGFEEAAIFSGVAVTTGALGVVVTKQTLGKGMFARL